MEASVDRSLSSNPARTGGTAVILAYAATIFFSAFLLFQVQPLISKFILPWFGGSPAVWTAAMLFFQMALFGGYLYAHLTSTYLSARGQFFLHAALLIAATVVALATYISPSESLKPTGDEAEPLLKILTLLSVTVGLPYFVLSSTGPLLQKWFSDAFEGVSPYRLFALSNFGSLLALLSYPFFFEIMFDSKEQAMIWSYGFAFFAACCAFCAWWTFKSRSAGTEPKHAPAGQSVSQANDAPPSPWQRFAWIALPALASVMFLAVTNELTQNITPVPLLWIIPLSLYLMSFIVAFDHPRWYSRPVYAAAAVVLLLYMANYRNISSGLEDVVNMALQLNDDNTINLRHSLAWRCVIYFGGLFTVCMICHCELVAIKPSTRYLTAFYLTMSLGGAVGGILINLVAPYVFKTYFELPLSLLVSIVIAAVLAIRSLRPADWTAPLAMSASFAAIAAMFIASYFPLPPGVPFLIAMAAALVSLGIGTAFKRAGSSQAPATTRSAGALPVWGFAGVAVALLGWNVVDEMVRKPGPPDRFEYQGRNFYGTVSARHNNLDRPEEAYLTFKSGSVAHGRQWSHPDRQRITEIAYWGPETGCRRALEYATAKYDKCRIGVVGLGIGTIAGFAKPGQYCRLYEINPQVVDIAENNFFYLKNARTDGVKIDVVLGDARLKLERELAESGSHQFDVLCLDAFSGDAVPMHLLTTEAFATYKAHLAPNGIIVANTINTYLDLYPVVRRLAEEHGFKYTRVFKDPHKEKCFPTYFVLITNDEVFLHRTPEDMEGAVGAYAKFKEHREAPLWTDGYHSLWHVLH